MRIFLKNFKRGVCVLLLLCIGISAFGCKDGENMEGEASEMQTEVEATTDEEEKEELSPTVTVSYMPDALRKEMSELIKFTSSYSALDAPYAIQNIYSVGNGKLKSFSFPVAKTLLADLDGNFILSAFIFGTADGEIGKAPKRTYSLKINKDKYGLSENSTDKKYLTVNMEEYDIVLAENETIAFYHKNDTIIPAYLSERVMDTTVSDIAPEQHGFFYKVGTDGYAAATGALLYDFEFEYSREVYDEKISEQNEYKALVSELKEKYEGKTVSVLGDSISTYTGFSNNTSHNSTIGDTSVYYTPDRLPSADATYWGRLIKESGMTLCVNNSSGGSKVYENHAKSGVNRATELDRNDGTNPDVILVFMGTNDLGGYSKGAMFSLYQSTGTLESWWQSLKTKTQNATVLNAGTSFTCFEEAYALMLYRMKEAYPNAEIFCMGVLPANHDSFTAQKHADINSAIKLIGEFFGAEYVDTTEYTGITSENCRVFCMDAVPPRAIHLNVCGHKKLMCAVAKTMTK